VNGTPSSDQLLKMRIGRWGKTTLKTRLFEKVLIDPSTECWIWAASTWKGYGRINVDQRPEGAHVAMYRVYGGVISDGLTLDHLCRNTLCVNPEHLEPTTRAENTLRQLAAIGHHNALKTHCVNGHEFSPDNIRAGLKPHHRVCRTCCVNRNREYRRRMRAAA
jgi:hypothetical protein